MNRALLLLALTLPMSAGCTEPEYPCKIGVKVADEEGVPIVAHTVTIGTFDRWQPSEGAGRNISKRESAETNKDGLAAFEITSRRGDIGINLFPYPEGFYGTHGYSYQFEAVEEGRWAPESPTIKCELRRKRNPIPMYARRVGVLGSEELPKLGEPVGFDLVVSDWVVPHGRGKTADIIFEMERRFVNIYDFDTTLKVTFSNEGDGLISASRPLREGSHLRLDYEAPEDGYQPELVKRAFAHPPSKAINVGYDKEENYYLRVRAQLDEKGKVISAQYGKIHGDFEFARFEENRHIEFAYYLNPTPGDRNVEFDPERNLLEVPDGSLRVTEP